MKLFRAAALGQSDETRQDEALAGRRRAWLLTEAANEPFFALVQRFIFSAYFANQLVVADPMRGTQLWAAGLAAAGFLTAVCAPVAGAISDATGQRRRWVGWLTALCALACGALWFATPGAPAIPFLATFVFAAVSLELIVALTNAELVNVAKPGGIGMASGLNFAVGQLAAVAALVLVGYLTTFARAGGDGQFAGRIVGPIAGVALVVLLLPYLLSAARADRPALPHVGKAMPILMRGMRDAMADRNMRLLIIGRAVGADGLSIVFAFGAILAGSLMGWSGGELAIFGVIVTLFAAAGGVLAGILDRRLGSRASVLLSFVLGGAGTVGIMGAGFERALFVTVGAEKVWLGYSLPELAYIGSTAVVALSAGPCFGGMRALMAKIAPMERMGVFFGIYSLVGKATYFLGPLAFGLALQVSGDQQTALLVVYPFLAVGFAAFLAIREERMTSL